MQENKQAEVKPKKTTSEVDAQHNSAGVYVLQWLTYAFWGWLILALVWLMGIILTNAITGQAVEGSVPYAIAATVVLLPIAFVVDFLYRKHEPLKKQRVASVIMVIHAVLFALLGIGTLIGAVFVALSMAIESNRSSDGQTVALWTLAFAAVLYIVTFVRTLNPFKSAKGTVVYGFGVLALSLLLLVLAIVGPMVKSISLKDDRRIEQHLSTVNNEVEQYIRDNNALPDTLNQVEYSSDEAEALVEDGLVTYKKVGKVEKTKILSSDTYRYQLCVTYKQASERPSYATQYNDDDYKGYLSAYSHQAGDVCYKQEVSVYADRDDVTPSL